MNIYRIRNYIHVCVTESFKMDEMDVIFSTVTWIQNVRVTTTLSNGGPQEEPTSRCHSAAALTAAAAVAVVVGRVCGNMIIILYSIILRTA